MRKYEVEVANARSRSKGRRNVCVDESCRIRALLSCLQSDSGRLVDRLRQIGKMHSTGHRVPRGKDTQALYQAYIIEAPGTCVVFHLVLPAYSGSLLTLLCGHQVCRGK